MASLRVGEDSMPKQNVPPYDLKQWIEYVWLFVSNPTFRNSRNRRRAYYEHCLARSITRPWL
jgi:hypothetical protein